MRIPLLHVHGPWTTSFVQEPHTCLLLITEQRGPDGLGRACTWDRPDSVVEVPAHALRDTPFDAAIRYTGELPHAAVRRYRDDPAPARETRAATRQGAMEGYGLKRFLKQWDDVLIEAAS